jgi:hypothetical protein
MTEHAPPPAADDHDGRSVDDGAEEDLGHSSSEEPLETGIPEVDAVIASVDRLDDRPLDDHLPEFERAHQALRSALDADPSEPA